jgi:peptidoglycan/LPS O-acetylase OafA/YrhL
VEKTSPVKHLGYLDGLRGLAALFVVLHHAYLQVDGETKITGIIGRALEIFSHGRYSVDLFIVLSGFCLMLPVVKGNGEIRGGAWKFFQRRAWRILPTYYLALALSWVLGMTIISQRIGLWGGSIPVSWKSLVTHLFLVHDIFGDDHNINYVFWSIAVEWRIYFLFPLLLLPWRRLGGVKTTLVAVVFSYALFVVCKLFTKEGLTAHYIGLFTMGMLGASIAFSHADSAYERLQKRSWGHLVFWITLVVVAISMVKIRNGAGVPESVRDILLGVWAMCLLVMVSQRESGWIYNFLSWKPLTFLGTFAYSIYLMHAPLLQIVDQYLLIPGLHTALQKFLFLSLIGTPLILAGSYLFFLACERPFLHKKAKTSEPIGMKTALEPTP